MLRFNVMKSITIAMSTHKMLLRFKSCFIATVHRHFVAKLNSMLKNYHQTHNATGNSYRHYALEHCQKQTYQCC